jgi:hypothetical protein
MATTSYENALRMAESLSRDEQLRLIQELAAHTEAGASSNKKTSVLELCGLGQEIWLQMDAQDYVNRERASWNG